MKRRKLDTTSGLDLFLDTICNTFGGIVFISMCEHRSNCAALIGIKVQRSGFLIFSCASPCDR